MTVQFLHLDGSRNRWLALAWPSNGVGCCTGESLPLTATPAAAM
jgi:hypothetical protein